MATGITIGGGNAFSTLQILQIQEGSQTSADSTSTTAFGIGTNRIKVTITPRLSTSKILLIVTGTASQGNGASGYITIASTTNNGVSYTNLGDATVGLMGMVSNNNYQVAMHVYDSPGTTSSIDYYVQKRSGSNGISTSFPTSNGLLGTPPAYITAIEIAQ